MDLYLFSPLYALIACAGADLTYTLYILGSWDRASLMYSNKTNKTQRYTMVFITINALHVSGGSSAHHQELKTTLTASAIFRAFSASYRYRE